MGSTDVTRVRVWQSKRGQALLLIIVLVAAFLILASLPLDSTKPAASTSRDFRSIVIKGIDGEEFTLNSFRGKVVVLEFMASWCASCAQQVSILKEFYAKYGSDLVLISVSMDPGFDTPDVLRSYISKKGISWVTGRDTTLGLTDYFKVQDLPTIVIMRTDGAVDQIFRGVTDLATLSEAVDRLLE